MIPQHEKELFQQAIDKWGQQDQLEMCVEECSELILAIKHLHRGKCDANAVRSEIADVSIMVDQMMIIFGEHACGEVRSRKLNQLRCLIEKS